MLFIRLDEKGTWRGTEHRSSFAHDPADEENIPWENGISCYQLNGWGIHNLRWYWTEYAMFRMDDFENFQVTVFEGELTGEWGSTGEDLAICTRTVVEADAVPFMKSVIEAYERYEDEEITEEEYLAELERIAKELLSAFA